MKKIIKNFIIWFASIIVCTVIYGISKNIEVNCAITMAVFWFFPMRAIISQLIMLAIRFINSNYEGARKKIQIFSTFNTLVDPSSRELNPAFIPTIHTIVGIICMIVGVFHLVWRWHSTNLVYLTLKNVQTICQGLFGTGFQRTQVLIWLVLTVLTVIIVIWYLSLFLRGVAGSNNNSKEKIQKMIMVITFIVSRLKNYLLLSYTWSMIITSIIFWVLVIGIPIITFFVIKLFLKNAE